LHEIRADAPRQPLLDSAVVALRAPTQVWSDRDGSIGSQPVDGIYHGDVRHLDRLVLTCDDSDIEVIGLSRDGADRIIVEALLRGIDDVGADPRVRLVRERTVSPGHVEERIRVISRVRHALGTSLRLRARADFSSLDRIKAGQGSNGSGVLEFSASDVSGRATSGGAPSRASFHLTAPGAQVVDLAGDEMELSWTVRVDPLGTWEASWSLSLDDDSLVVHGAATPSPWDAIDVAALTPAAHPRLGSWMRGALDDLAALRMTLPDAPQDPFYAAGAPWFFTLFGRDSIWAARLTLPIDASIAASTLRVLARLQGRTRDDATAQEPGKIMHELRSTALELPHEGLRLPPLYYGTVDATPLWVCLLHDAWRAGMPESEVRALLPALQAALHWVTGTGDSDGDGFLDYVDRSGRGLSNQGWKDSGDSIQWRDGTLAEGPIALCEVQGYAYEAAMSGARLLDAFDQEGSAPLRAWAADLKERFAGAFWVTTPEGTYPAIALDAQKRPVDSLTSNVGHLLGTGILSAGDEVRVADLLLGTTMSSGFGIRTLSTAADGYWPLSYHGGTVWPHDTAIIVHGMLRAGLLDHARRVAEAMVDAAEGFDYRMPELFSGDSTRQASAPVPYPAACRPQAWSAAAAVTAWSALTQERVHP